MRRYTLITKHSTRHNANICARVHWVCSLCGRIHIEALCFVFFVVVSRSNNICRQLENAISLFPAPDICWWADRSIGGKTSRNPWIFFNTSNFDQIFTESVCACVVFQVDGESSLLSDIMQPPKPVSCTRIEWKWLHLNKQTKGVQVFRADLFRCYSILSVSIFVRQQSPLTVKLKGFCIIWADFMVEAG